jgi:hypothetical protein
MKFSATFYFLFPFKFRPTVIGYQRAIVLHCAADGLLERLTRNKS